MYLTIKEQITGMSKNLYNESLYSVRQFYFSEKKYLNYVANYHVCKDITTFCRLAKPMRSKSTSSAAEESARLLDYARTNAFLIWKTANGLLTDKQHGG